MSEQWIKASEIPEYLYCNRAWWLRRVKEAQSVNRRQMRRGAQFHDDHAGNVQQALQARSWAYALMALAAAIFIFTLTLL